MIQPKVMMMNDLVAAEQAVTVLLRKLVNVTHLELEFTLAQHPGSRPDLTIEFAGQDVACLTARNAELLKAIEHVTGQVLRLESEEHDRLSFDAGGYKRNRHHALQASAHCAAAQVLRTGLPFNFAPMSSYERRQLHLMLNAMGLRTASHGEGPERRLILYPPVDCNCSSQD